MSEKLTREELVSALRGSAILARGRIRHDYTWEAGLAEQAADMLSTPPAAAPVEPQAVERVAEIRARVNSGDATTAGSIARQDIYYLLGLTDRLQAALASVPAPPGFVTVPVEPTEAMKQAAVRSDYNGSPIWVYLADAGLDARLAVAIYRAMISAAPCAPLNKP